MPATPTIAERWASRDLPVLRFIVSTFDTSPGEDVSGDLIASALETNLDEAEAAVRNLQRGGYLGEVTWGMGGWFSVEDITERALRETGAWPNPEQQADQLLWLLQQKIDQAPTPEDRSRWVRIRDSIGAAGRDLTVELAAAMTMRTMGA